MVGRILGEYFLCHVHSPDGGSSDEAHAASIGQARLIQGFAQGHYGKQRGAGPVSRGAAKRGQFGIGQGDLPNREFRSPAFCIADGSHPHTGMEKTLETGRLTNPDGA